MTAVNMPTSRGNWLVLWVALSSAPILYGVIAPSVATSSVASPALGYFRGAFFGGGAVAAALGVLLLSKASRSGGELAPPAQFAVRSVVAMALFESVAVFGFVLTFLGAPPAEVWLWSAANLVLLVAVALPAGLGYWSEWERVAGRGAAAR